MSDLPDADAPLLPDLLEQHREALLRMVANEGRGLAGRDSTEDLVQDICLRALRQEDQFTYRSEPEFFAWLRLIARQQIADRHDYWSALRRQAGHLLRITSSSSTGSTGSPAVRPAGDDTGPATFADRREMLELASKSLAMMLERDRDLVRRISLGQDISELAEHLGITYSAAEIAKRRALERFRKTFELLRRS
jgi:RNA polymerase sigma factor (sigma-70 family)